METKTNLDLSEIRKVSSSQAMLRLADSVLSLDREVVSEVLTTYLYFRSLGKTNRDFVLFLTTKKMGTSADIGFKLLPALASGLLSDRDFRSIMVGILKSAIRNP